MANSGDQCERQAFQRQPARAVLVDFHPPMDAGTCLNICEALGSTISLTHHLAGPTRIPVFCLMVLGNYPECIFPLQPVKGNFPRVMSAVNELRTLARSMVVRPQSRGCLLEGLQDALAQFHRLSQNVRQGPGGSTFPSQIELTVITSQSPTTLRKGVERIADSLDLEYLRKISGVCVSDPDRITQPAPDPEGDEEMAMSPSELGLSILDLTSIDNDVLSLQNVFKSWLHDLGTDSEHLHLLLPPATGDGGGVRELHSLTLKCDMQERILDPCSLSPFGQQFMLHTATTTSHHSTSRGSGNATSSTQSVPVYRLKAVSLVSAEGVCESVLYGTPYILRPTACWKLEWEELESNQHHFHALCTMLQDRGLMLLAAADLLTHSSVHPHFLLLPSPSLTLLVKPVVVSELLLPVELPCTEDQPPQQALQSVRCSLDRLEVRESYNPLLVHSGLHEALAALSSSKRGLSVSRGGGRSSRGVFQPPVHRESQSTSGRGRGGGRSLGTKRSYAKGGLGFRAT